MSTQTIQTAPRNPELPTVANSMWYVSTSSSQTWYYSPEFRIEDEFGVTLEVWRWVYPGRPDLGTIRHELDGTLFETREDANRAAYEASLVGQRVR